MPSNSHQPMTAGQHTPDWIMPNAVTRSSSRRAVARPDRRARSHNATCDAGVIPTTREIAGEACWHHAHTFRTVFFSVFTFTTLAEPGPCVNTGRLEGFSLQLT